MKEKKEDKDAGAGGPKKFHYLGEQKKLVRTYARYTLKLGASWSRGLGEVVSARGVALSDLSLSDWSQCELDALYRHWSVECPGMEALREHWVGEKRLQDPSFGTSIMTSGGVGGGRWGGRTAAAAAAADPSSAPSFPPSYSSFINPISPLTSSPSTSSSFSSSPSSSSSSSASAEALKLPTAGAAGAGVEKARATTAATTTTAAATATAVKWEKLKAMMRQVRDFAGALSRAKNGKEYPEIFDLFSSAGRGEGGREGGRKEGGRVRCVSRATSMVGDWEGEEGRKNGNSSSSSSGSSSSNGSDKHKGGKRGQEEEGMEGGQGEEREEGGGPVRRRRMDMSFPPYTAAGAAREDMEERLKEGMRKIQERLKEVVGEMEEIMGPPSLRSSLPPS